MVDNHGLTAAYSTFRGYISKVPVFQSYFDRTTETLQDALVEFFEQLQGVPHVLVTDNMKTVIVQPRLAGTKGQLHTKAEQFSSDFGFTFKPCIARRPQTKGKVESQMKILDEIHAYQGKLTIQEVEKQVQNIILRSNLAISQATRQIPTVLLAKEKESLTPLPTKVIRDSYRIDYPKAKVSTSNFINLRGSHYSVPPGYVAKSITLKTIALMKLVICHYNLVMLICYFKLLIDGMNRKVPS